MDKLLSGLKNFGLGNLEEMSLFEDDSKKKAPQKSVEPQKKTVELTEEDVVLSKTCDCPVCGKKVKYTAMKTGKNKLVSTDIDLRPKYSPVEPLKYEVISCRICGFTALSRYFVPMAPSQKKAIVDNISQTFIPSDEKLIFSYEEAMERYKLALANAIVKKAKNSEKAYICLKTGWLLRGQAEELDKSAPDYEKKKEELKNQEDVFLKNALEGFTAARATEQFPMCGMDETTMDYLLAALAVRFEKYDMAAKLVGSILTSQTANSRVKDKARNLKEIILEAKKA